MRTLSRSLIPLFASLLLIAACDKKDDKKADDKKAEKADDKKADDKQPESPRPDAEPPQPEPAAAVLTLGAAKIMEKDKPDEAIEILPDGTVKMGTDPQDSFKIAADGKISKIDGTEIGQVAADGSLSFGGKPSGVVLNDTGLTLTSPDGKTATVKFNEDGSVETDPPAGDGLQLAAEGCTGPMAKTCAVVMTMFVLRAEPAPGEAAEAAEAVAEKK